MLLSKLIALGTEQQSFSTSSKIRMVNIISLISAFIAAGYSINYFFVLQQPFVALINTFFIFGYIITFVFMYFHAPKNAKIWFFMVLIVHLYVCTNIYVTKDSGFHLYYFLVPTGAFLLFEFHDKFEKILLSFLAVILMVYCENTVNLSPLIVLSDEVNNILYQSVIITNMLEVIIVIVIFNNQLETNEKKLKYQATTDPLTSIANRHHFFELGELLVKDSNLHHRPFSVVIFDFDYFRKINDNFGHAFGDLCLINVANLIKSECRENDLFSRIGGEEFAIALPDTTALEAEKIAELMRSKVAKHLVCDDVANKKSQFKCTLSFGIADKIDHTVSLKYLMLNADKALYRAKNEGRNRVKIFHAGKFY
ncbi:MAG: GGDEF domain-containing protein [Alteromonadaceae bacterium]|jgi:diguanylate cyclase (GGDEF)-like protein